MSSSLKSFFASMLPLYQLFGQVVVVRSLTIRIVIVWETLQWASCTGGSTRIETKDFVAVVFQYETYNWENVSKAAKVKMVMQFPIFEIEMNYLLRLQVSKKTAEFHADKVFFSNRILVLCDRHFDVKSRIFLREVTVPQLAKKVCTWDMRRRLLEESCGDSVSFYCRKRSRSFHGKTILCHEYRPKNPWLLCYGRATERNEYHRFDIVCKNKASTTTAS